VKPVSAGKQWTLWPRVARPFACRTCGTEYGCALDDEVESKARQFMREVGEPETVSLVGRARTATSFTHDRVPRFRFCRRKGCLRFYDYDEESRRRARDEWTSPLLHGCTPMRKRWLPVPLAANGGSP
jgi:hypothetical protein